MDKLIWNYDDVDTNILKVYDVDTMIGYFRIDTGAFTFAQRKVHSVILRQMMNEYDSALNEARLIAEN